MARTALPLVDAAIDLIEADDTEFARRCQLMRDEEGRAMLGELAGSCSGSRRMLAM